jgi:hypothetical protein
MLDMRDALTKLLVEEKDLVHALHALLILLSLLTLRILLTPLKQAKLTNPANPADHAAPVILPCPCFAMLQVPKIKTLEETIWDQMTSLLPKETIAKNLFSDKAVFEQYTTLLKTNVTKVFNEEKIFTDKLSTNSFCFSFEIAIDAYPQVLASCAPAASAVALASAA